MRIKYNRTSTIQQEGERFKLDKDNYDLTLFDKGVSGKIPFSEREKGRELTQLVQNGEVDFSNVVVVVVQMVDVNNVVVVVVVVLNIVEVVVVVVNIVEVVVVIVEKHGSCEYSCCKPRN